MTTGPIAQVKLTYDSFTWRVQLLSKRQSFVIETLFLEKTTLLHYTMWVFFSALPQDDNGDVASSKGGALVCCILSLDGRLSPGLIWTDGGVGWLGSSVQNLSGLYICLAHLVLILPRFICERGNYFLIMSNTF